MVHEGGVSSGSTVVASLGEKARNADGDVRLCNKNFSMGNIRSNEL